MQFLIEVGTMELALAQFFLTDLPALDLRLFCLTAQSLHHLVCIDVITPKMWLFSAKV